MNRSDYVAYLADLLSGDPERVRRANEVLYAEALDDPSELARPAAFALAEAEQQLTAPI